MNSLFRQRRIHTFAQFEIQTIAWLAMGIAMRILAVALLIASATTAFAQAAAPALVTPNFLLQHPDFIYYHPVVNANGTMAIFERTPVAGGMTVLYSINLSTLDVQPFVTSVAATRPDWCWNRTGGQLTVGPVAFSNDGGVYVVPVGSSSPTLLSSTAGMIYPSWYPDCLHMATDVTVPTDGIMSQVTAEIDATTGSTVRSPLANDIVWAGFPSVNQVNPNLVAFAGQNNVLSNYYNQDINFIWVTDTRARIPKVAPLDRRAPRGPSFVPIFQARAGWWSPDGKWFAFESNRSSNAENNIVQTQSLRGRIVKPFGPV
jgi:WD40-like Beta Propeller Repeat